MYKTFSPLLFLASLGAGGISVIPFAFLQYVHPHGKGLITLQEVIARPMWDMWVYWILGIVMVVFSVLHLVLTAQLIPKLVLFLRSEAYPALITDPLKNAAIMAPFISATMTLNVFIGPIRFFIPALAENLQVMMLPALVVWIALGFFLMRTVFKVIHTAFAQHFDVSKIHFGLLLVPFALGMFTVTGTGIAAIAHDTQVAHLAAAISIITGSFGLFLLVVKTVTLFASHVAAKSMPAQQFLPSILIVVPNITLYAISFFRLGHYLEHQFGVELGVYYLVVMGTAFAIETWYLLLGLYILRDYLKESYFKREYYVTLWGFVCPFVAYAVLASFVYSVFVPHWIFTTLVMLSGAVAIFFFVDIARRHMLCTKEHSSMECL